MIFPHGAQKLLGWFGGHGYTGTMNYFTETMSIPYFLALLAIVTEFFGGIALIAGVATRLAAMGVGITMVVAGYLHLSNGFFMNWSGIQQGEGYEFHILAIAIAAAIILKGGDYLSLDKILTSSLTCE